MPHNRAGHEQEIKNRYGFVVFDGQFSVFNAALIGMDVFVTGGTASLQYIKQTFGHFGQDVATEMIKARIDPTRETIYGNVMTFQTWDSPFLPVSDRKVYYPDTYVPYIAARKKPPPPDTPPHVAYQQRGLQTGTALGEVGSDNRFVFLMAPNRDIYAILKNETGSHTTEVHVLTAASNYQVCGLRTGTALGEVGSDNRFVFLMAPNRDIYAILKNATGSHTTEVHVLTAASNYQVCGLRTGTALEEVGSDNRFVFLMAPNRDIYAILKNATGSHTTEVHVLTAASNYQVCGLRTGTALEEVGSDNRFVFLTAPNRDIYAILKNATGSHSTEVHVLTAASNYKQRGLQTGTALHEVGSDDQFEFLLAPNHDIYAIKKSGTGTNNTEVHVLTAASKYQQFGLHTGTALGEVGSDNRFAFLLAPNLDIYAILKSGTGTKSTEVHVLKR